MSRKEVARSDGRRAAPVRERGAGRCVEAQLLLAVHLPQPHRDRVSGLKSTSEQIHLCRVHEIGYTYLHRQPYRRTPEEKRMSQVEAIFQNGVFKPLGDVALADNQRVRLTFQAVTEQDVATWLEEVRRFQQQLIDRRGPFPDSTHDIAADRAHDE
jgi:predicted DNA-binding antitoxin AbrB/MazE fold protein